MSNSERRLTPRAEVKASANVQTLGISAAANGKPFPVQVIDASDRGMRLHSTEPLKAGQALKIEMGESMFLGEVCYCAPAIADGQAVFYVGVVTDECLTGLNGLQHLIRALEPETANEREPAR